MSTSSYFDEIYSCAEKLISNGLAYVDDLSPDEMRELRGTLTSPGQVRSCEERESQAALFAFNPTTF